MTIEQYITNFGTTLQKLIFTDINGNILNNASAIEHIVTEFIQIKSYAGAIYLIGNGGSSGIVSHTSVDLLNTCKIKAIPITDNSQITCFANDFGYENVYSKPLEVFLSKNDMLIAVSSSGNSKNICNAADIAAKKGCPVLTLSGFKTDNNLRKKGNQNIWVDSSNYGIVEIGHALILHYITDQITHKLKDTL